MAALHCGSADSRVLLHHARNESMHRARALCGIPQGVLRPADNGSVRLERLPCDHCRRTGDTVLPSVCSALSFRSSPNRDKFFEISE